MAMMLAGGGRPFRWIGLLVFALLLGATPAVAARFFVLNVPGELDPATKVRIETPRPVQLLFTFQTNGAPNMRATNFVKEQVGNDVRGSGLFSEVAQAPVADGAVLSITINNIPERGAAGRGFRTGLTFGLAGTTVTDDYEITFEYLSGPTATPIRRVVRHAIRTTIGRTDPPTDVTRARNPEEALRTVVRQSLAHGLNQLGGDPAFVPALTGTAPQP
ncbi:MAG TPA: hypothetical protein VMS43_12695 [Allosphingosinicella sp.]|nr:hypothetical protein [Allosphingosinicella sp.]